MLLLLYIQISTMSRYILHFLTHIFQLSFTNKPVNCILDCHPLQTYMDTLRTSLLHFFSFSLSLCQWGVKIKESIQNHWQAFTRFDKWLYQQLIANHRIEDKWILSLWFSFNSKFMQCFIMGIQRAFHFIFSDAHFNV